MNPMVPAEAPNRARYAPRMLDALSQLHLQAVRWIGMPSAVLN